MVVIPVAEWSEKDTKGEHKVRPFLSFWRSIRIVCALRRDTPHAASDRHFGAVWLGKLSDVTEDAFGVFG